MCDGRVLSRNTVHAFDREPFLPAPDACLAFAVSRMIAFVPTPASAAQEENLRPLEPSRRMIAPAQQRPEFVALALGQRHTIAYVCSSHPPRWRPR